MTQYLYLLIGGNLGERLKNLEQVRDLLKTSLGEIVAQSAIYETAAWGGIPQPDFLNQVVAIHSDYLPQQILAKTQAIETAMGRQRLRKWGARVMDIDILFYGQQTVNTPNLTIPHPYLHLRRFTLIPMVEIAPDWRHIVLGKTMKQLLANCSDELEVKRLEAVCIFGDFIYDI